MEGPPVEFDFAEISINIDGSQADITVAVIDDMGTDAMLGQDIPFISYSSPWWMKEARRKFLCAQYRQGRKQSSSNSR